MQLEGVRVLVVGAGPAGLAAARTLHRAGATVRLVERSPHASGEGAGLYLPGNAVRALRQLGLDAEVTDRAHRIERQRFSDHRGRHLFEVRVDEVWSGVGACLALPRAELHDVLLAGVSEVPITWGAGPVDVTIDGQRIAVELDDGSTDEYDLVLGADGIHSSVRRLAFGADLPRPVGQHARRFVVAGAVEPADLERTWSILLGRGSSFLTIPIGGGRVYCYCDGPADSARTSLRELLAGYAAPVPDLLDLLEQSPHATVQEGAIEEVDLPTWSRGAVLLVGDAAHATSPNMAEGAAMALEDAVVLAESLATAPDVAAGFALFQRRRRPRTTWVREQTHRRDRARSMVPVVRNLVLARFGRRIFGANYRPLREPV